MVTKFNSFRHELNSLSGYHTGDKLVVRDNAINDEEVHFHESIHGRIFRELPDGILHAAILKMLAKNLTPKYNSQLSELNEFLFSETRLPHERAATFLGIVALPDADSIIGAANKLDDTYSSYFQFFADKLWWQQSTFVSFVVAWATTRFAFASARLQSLQSIDQMTAEFFSSIPGPAERLEEGWSTFASMTDEDRRDLCKALFEIAFAHLGIEPFNCFEDDAWRNRIQQEVDDTSRLDMFFCELFERHLENATGLEFHRRSAIPEFLKQAFDQMDQRTFPEIFAISKDGPQYNEEAASYHARQADSHIIQREHFISFPSSDIDTAFLWATHNCSSDTVISFTQVQFDLDSFKMTLTAKVGDERSFAPGTGTMVSLSQIAGFCESLSGLIIERHYSSPKIYITYSGDKDGPKNAKIWIPQSHDATKLFTNHFASSGEPAPGQGAIIRPFVYCRQAWSKVLSEIGGELLSSEIQMLDKDINNRIDYVFQVLQPNARYGFPCLAIMTPQSGRDYRAFLRHLKKSGQIEDTSVTEIDQYVQDCLVSIWQSRSSI